MADKLHHFGHNGRGDVYCFFCPGCGDTHPVEVPRWTWNGSMARPTFTPSLLCNAHHAPSRCHSFVADGKIQFLSDCHHKLAGQTVEIPDWDEATSPEKAAQSPEAAGHA